MDMVLEKPQGLKTLGKLVLHYPSRHNAAIASKPRITILQVTTFTLAVALTYLILWSTTLLDISGHAVKISRTRPSNPADKWLDNDWPYHEQEPWDISTDFAYPRVLEYEVGLHCCP
jgi:hypothetical protein